MPVVRELKRLNDLLRRHQAKVPGPPCAINAPPISHKTTSLAFQIRKEAGIDI